MTAHPSHVRIAAEGEENWHTQGSPPVRYTSLAAHDFIVDNCRSGLSTQRPRQLQCTSVDYNAHQSTCSPIAASMLPCAHAAGIGVYCRSRHLAREKFVGSDHDGNLPRPRVTQDRSRKILIVASARTPRS